MRTHVCILRICFCGRLAIVTFGRTCSYICIPHGSAGALWIGEKYVFLNRRGVDERPQLGLAEQVSPFCLRLKMTWVCAAAGGAEQELIGLAGC